MVITCVRRVVMDNKGKKLSGRERGKLEELVWGVAQRLKKPTPTENLELLYVEPDKKSRRSAYVVYVSALVESSLPDRDEINLHRT